MEKEHNGSAPIVFHSQIRKGKITLSFPMLLHKSPSSGNSPIERTFVVCKIR